jgi:GH24 family phage-related lysozyme (muramidase)
MSKISKENRKKTNKIYNQCVVYALIAGALSVPFLTPVLAPLIKTKGQGQKKYAVARTVTASSTVALSTEEPTPEIKLEPAQPSPPVTPTPIPTPTPAPTPEPSPPQMTPAPEAAKPVVEAKVTETKATETKVTTAKESAPVEMIVPIQSKTVVPVALKSTIQIKGQITIQNTKIDRHFIDKMEGVVMKGYVPLPKTTKSGVTIGSGFDLGQMHPKEFKQLPINEALKAKLLPYVGLRQFKAVAFLKAHPLKINTIELQEVNAIAANKILQPLVKSYNKASKVSFTDLPPEAQTALFSFAYQYGPGFMKKSSTSRLWHYYVAQDWAKVSQTLRSFKMYSPRRRQEAQLIMKLHK